jgi:hypothetical protein
MYVHEKQTVAKMQINFLPFSDVEGSLPYSKVSATVPSLAQTNAVHNVPSFFFKSHFDIVLPTTPRFVKLPFPK